MTVNSFRHLSLPFFLLFGFLLATFVLMLLIFKEESLVLSTWRQIIDTPAIFIQKFRKESCPFRPNIDNQSHGGWRYTKEVISGQHVTFDDGFGQSIVEFLGNRPVTVGDIGAGVGQLGAWLTAHNHTHVQWYGWDGGENVQDFAGQNVSLRGGSEIVVPPICYIDATVDLRPLVGLMTGAPYDWVVSVEVGEHIPALLSSVYLDNLVLLSRKGVILTWAIKGQGGHMHVNELNNEEVEGAMRRRGLEYMREESVDMRARVTSLRWLRETIMVFRKSH